jgi:hypothetical protein
VKLLEKQEQTNLKINRRKEIKKIRDEINEVETKRAKQRVGSSKKYTRLTNPSPN